MKYYFYFFISASILMTSCIDDDFGGDCIEGQGPITGRSYTVDEFSKLVGSFSADIQFTYDSVVSVTAFAQENILDRLSVATVGGILEPRLVGDCFNNFSLTFEITGPDVSEFELLGSGDLTIMNGINIPSLSISSSGSGNVETRETLRTDELNVSLVGSGGLSLNTVFDSGVLSLTGSGGIEVQGSCEEQEVSLTGSGNYRAFGLSSNSCNISVAGSGSSEVFVNDDLNVSILGSGNVTYMGDPDIISEVIGSGRLINGN